MSWIKISDHAPTAADFGPTKAVEYYRASDGQRLVFHGHSYNSPEAWTHWRTVDLPPPPAKELTQRQLDHADSMNNADMCPVDYRRGIYAERRAIKEIISLHGAGKPIESSSRELMTRLNEQGGA